MSVYLTINEIISSDISQTKLVTGAFVSAFEVFFFRIYWYSYVIYVAFSFFKAERIRKLLKTLKNMKIFLLNVKAFSYIYGHYQIERGN